MPTRFPTEAANADFIEEDRDHSHAPGERRQPAMRADGTPEPNQRRRRLRREVDSPDKDSGKGPDGR